MSDPGQSPVPQDLQFQHAEPLPADGSANANAQRCVVCKAPIGAAYFHAQGHVVCPACAERIQSGQQAPPAISLGAAVLYGVGAALAGCILYAGVAILLNLEIGIVAIVVGIMVGKAVRAGSKGLGGRPQQILAVLLTYFSITTSYIPVYFHHLAKNPKQLEQLKENAAKAPTTEAPKPPTASGALAGLVILVLLFAAAPLFGLTTGVGGLISLFIIFIGLRQAWRLTARSEILVMGPYQAAPAQ
ncbi:MAG TPA: hypothetical protein VMH28_01425 [Candidatus Acidoferrales bacterium]|nr:hypothetical protein [Candidatus Acidoferrales bacterium]